MTDSNKGENSPLTPGQPNPKRINIDLDDIINVWWSRYCPECNSRRPVTETNCPHDGTALRDLSIATGGSLEPTDCFGTTLGPGEVPLPPEPASVSQEADSLLGSTIGGKWRAIRKLGGGTFGTFLVGEHAILGMAVGIKILRRRFTKSDRGRQLFHQEAMRLSRLNHPGIVKVLDYGEEGDRHYLVMELLNGKPLHAALAEHPPSLEDAVEIVRQVAEALIAAHSGVGTGGPLVHLDLKPEHIFTERIQGQLHVKVIDFGIAEIALAPGTDRDLSAETVSDRGKPRKGLAGTLPYMAPERWDGAADPRCDLYSLGIILYELVAGRKPIVALDPELMGKLHREFVPRPPSHGRPGGATRQLRALDRIVLWLLAKDPARRPQSAQELVAALKEWQARNNSSPGARLGRAAVAAAVALILAGSVLFWAPWDQVSLLSPASPVVLGPNSQPRLQAVGTGPGYEDAFLRVKTKSGPRDLRLTALDHRRLSDGLYPAWKELRESLELPEELQEELKDVAVVVFRGWLGREAASNPISLALDNRPPRVLRLSSVDAPDELAPDATTLPLVTRSRPSRLTITADEDIRLSAEGAASAWAHSVEVVIPSGASSLRLKIVDRAENSLALDYEVEWRSDDVPPLVTEPVIYTNAYPTELELKWRDRPARVEVALEGQATQTLTPTQQESTATWDATVLVPFEDSATEAQTRTVKVALWSDLRAKDASSPDRESTVEVHYLRRELRIVRLPPPDEFPVFGVTDANGNLLNKEPLDWKASVVFWSGGRDTPEGWDYSVGGSELRAEDASRDAAGNIRGGKYLLVITVTDRFKNQSVPLDPPTYAHAITPPALTFRPHGRESPLRLHHASCLCNDNPNLQPIELEYEIGYLYPHPLVKTLRLGAGETGQRIVPLPEKEKAEKRKGVFRIAPSELWPHLSPGPNNELFLVVEDQQSGLAWEVSVMIEYEPSLVVKRLDDLTRPFEAPGREINFEVAVAGPSLESALIMGKAAKIEGDKARSRVSARIFGEGVGVTKVELELRRNNSCPHREIFDLVLEPIAGEQYVIAVGEALDDLELRYDSAGFWYTPLDSWPKLTTAYRRATGKQSMIASSGVSYNEAEAIVAWLNQELSSKLASGQEFHLPSVADQKHLWRLSPKTAATGKSHREWVLSDSSDEELAGILRDRGSDAALVTHGETRPVFERASRQPDSFKKLHLAPFRLVLPHVDGGKFQPRFASRS